MSHPLGAAAMAFVREHLASLDELELLMRLMSSPERWWDATTAARSLGIPVHRARAMLDGFVSRNLLDIRITEDLRYQFRPGTAELTDAATAVAIAYRRNPAPVIQAVARSAPRSVRDFADAFRIRRRDRA